MLSGLKDRMMAPEIAAEAMRAYAEETNRLNRERRSNADVWQVEQVKAEKQFRGIIEAIKEGMFHPSMKAEMDTLEARKIELASLLSDVPDDVPDLLPSASAVYARKVGRLTDALNHPEERLEAAEALRALIEKVVLTPGPNRGEIDAMLYGELGTILTWIKRQAIGKAEKRNTPGAGLRGVSVSVVAGAGLLLSLQQSQVESKAGLRGCFNELFSAHA
ncbi:recombinase [Acetobacter senegalensis]|uniref:Recombinase n=1 Tax=Acetobacter senegalensis TaxID=446692 RepID=A0A0U5BDP7_9PROT|nr:DNA resolvase [Acetobacter senegalensis]CEF42434.1 recombinase [Acetobacter senegalensis]